MSDAKENSVAFKCLKTDFASVPPETKGVIYEIGAEWCGGCREFKAFYETSEGKKLLDSYSVKIVDFDKDKQKLECLDEGGFINKNKVMMPLFLFFASNGQFVGRLTSGFDDKNDFIKELKKAFADR